MENKNEEAVKKPSSNVFDIFVEGARKGWHIGVNNMLPNVLMAYVIAYILTVLGVMDLLGSLLGPVMALWGPSRTGICCFCSRHGFPLLRLWALQRLFIRQEFLSGQDITILMPAFYLLGSQLQYMGRLLGTSDVPKKYWPLLMSASLLNTLLAMFVMKFLILFF